MKYPESAFQGCFLCFAVRPCRSEIWNVTDLLVGSMCVCYSSRRRWDSGHAGPRSLTTRPTTTRPYIIERGVCVEVALPQRQVRDGASGRLVKPVPLAVSALRGHPPGATVAGSSTASRRPDAIAGALFSYLSISVARSVAVGWWAMLVAATMAC